MSAIELPLMEPQLHEYKISRRQSVLSNYDPSAHPPNLQFAKNHGKAQRVGYYIPLRQDIERCPCCLQPIHKIELNLTCNLRQLLHLGCAYPLYFYFIKQCMVLLTIILIFCTIPELIINLTKGNVCVQLDGNVNNLYTFICKCSVINIMNMAQIDIMQAQSIINFITIMISIILIGFIDVGMAWQYNTYYNDYSILPRASDYSVMIRGLPKDITISEIQQFVVNKIKQKNQPDVTLHKLYLIFDLKTFYALYANNRSMIEQITRLEREFEMATKKIQELTNENKPLLEIAKYYQQRQEALQRLSELENKQEMIQIQLNKYEQLFKMVAERLTHEQPIDSNVQTLTNGENKELNTTMASQSQIKIDAKSPGKLRFSGKCILTLNSTQSKDALTEQTRNLYFLQKLGHSVGECLGQTASTIIITDAPEPEEIIYSNIGSDKLRRWKDRIYVTASFSLCILIDFVVLTLEKKALKEQKITYSINYLITFLNSQLISLCNTIVALIIYYFENKTQKHSTLTSFYYSVTYKLVVLSLINMLITTFFSNMVNYYFIQQKPGTFDNFPLNFQQFLFDIFFLLLVSPINSFILIWFDRRQASKYIMQYRIEHRNYPVSQAEANLYYENMQIDLANKYTNIYRFMLFSAGVTLLFPPALIICLMTLFVYYWEDKYLLLRRYVVPHKLNFRLTEKMQKMLWSFPLMMSIANFIIMFVPIQDGQAFVDGKYSKGFYYLSLVALIISILIFLGGCQWIVALIEKCCCKRQKTLKHPQYKDIERDFEEDYWHHYPYFKIRKRDDTDLSSSRVISPRKQKIDELHKKMGMDVFEVIKNHLHHERYAPIV